MGREGDSGSDYAENVAVVVIVVIHEQVAGVSVVVEVIREMPHQLFEVIAVVYDFSCEVFLAVVLTDVAVLEVFEFFTAPVDECVHSVRRILVAQVAVFSYSLEAVLVEARFVVPFLGERLVVLEHQFRIFLVSTNGQEERVRTATTESAKRSARET